MDNEQLALCKRYFSIQRAVYLYMIELMNNPIIDKSKKFALKIVCYTNGFLKKIGNMSFQNKCLEAVPVLAQTPENLKMPKAKPTLFTN